MPEQRGRKSAAEQSVTVVDGKFAEKPDPPEDLNDRQSEIWRKVVAGEPNEFFSTETLRGLLADYCRHRDSAEQLSSVISEFKADWLKSDEGAKKYKELLRMRELETRAVRSYATKLRLTNQSRYTPGHAATVSRNTPVSKKPWEL